MTHYADEDGDGVPDLAPEPVTPPSLSSPVPVTPPSPKVIAAAAWAFIAPVLLAAVLAVLGYLTTDDGRALLSGVPPVLQVAIYAAVAALSGGLAGYRQRDSIRELGARALEG